MIIQVSNLSKRYIIGHLRQRGDGLRHRIEDAFRAPWRWLKREQTVKRVTREEFWALKDLDFEIKKGEVVGIIGRNGAGKSTLLKILSRITEPTTGRIRMGGRVASLLEVGTGFHAELTGRENIFLNGAILGMTRAEIQRKFDEIVAFSEIEQFLDTPVKRYSSGMYVRLAFAVAAHLEPEILIVDEVLAVGDVEFQKKCLGKMQEVASSQGRTVLFVSHNMAAVKSLTTRGLLLHKGRQVADGKTDEVLEKYLKLGSKGGTQMTVQRRGTHTSIEEVKLVSARGDSPALYDPGTPFEVEVRFTTDGQKGLSLELFLVDASQNKLAMSSAHQFHEITLPAKPGKYVYKVTLDPLWLASGQYTIEAATSIVNQDWDHWVERAVTFEVPFSNPSGLSFDFKHSYGFGAIAWTPSELPVIRPVEPTNQPAVALT